MGMFWVGVIVGAIIGYMMCAMCTVSKKWSDQEEDKHDKPDTMQGLQVEGVVQKHPGLELQLV